MTEFRRGEIPPHILAIADQELASVNHLLDELITQWHQRQPEFDLMQFDELARTCAFMVADVLNRARATGILAALTVAIIRLARKATP